MKLTLAAVAAALVLVIAGCGSSNKSSGNSSSSGGSSSSAAAPPASSGGASSNLKLAADKSALKFDKSSLSAKAGNVTITMSNPSAIPHAVAITGNGVDQKGQTVQQGGTSTVTASLKPGTYTFYCPVDGHRQAGMQGTLTVK